MYILSTYAAATRIVCPVEKHFSNYDLYEPTRRRIDQTFLIVEVGRHHDTAYVGTNI